jgi:hypothetical protein
MNLTRVVLRIVKSYRHELCPSYQISYATEQGNSFAEQGILSSEHGIFSAERTSQTSTLLNVHYGALAWPRSGLKRGDGRRAAAPIMLDEVFSRHSRLKGHPCDFIFFCTCYLA